MLAEDCARHRLPVACIHNKDSAPAFGLPLDVDESRCQEFFESDCRYFRNTEGREDGLTSANPAYRIACTPLVLHALSITWVRASAFA
jgi:hypothetical protein